MFSLRHSLSLLLMFGSLTVLEGYKIDQSCRNAGIYNEVEQGLKEAFDMAQAAIDAIERAQVRTPKDPPHAQRVTNGWDEVPPRPKELQDLIQNLFAHDDIINENQQLPDVPADRKNSSPYKQTLKKIKLKRVYATLKGILTDIRDPGPTDNPGFNDAVFYCDGSRYQKLKDAGEKWALDTDYNVKRKWNEKHCKGVDGLAFAITHSSVMNRDNKPTPSTVQICFGMINFIKRNTGKGSFVSNNVGKVTSAVIQSYLGTLQQVDTFGNGLGVVLLHEMTHTSAGGVRDDVIVKKGQLFRLKSGKAYGWKSINRLAKTLPYVDTDAPTACDNNADNIAYFALGCKLMTDKQAPRVITNDGKVVRIQNGQPVTWNPNSWKRRWLEATGIPAL